MHPALVIAPLVATLVAACGDDERALTRDELLDPAACERCHPDHYRQWLGSSHAYAADDPVFVAMNARFQRDTGGGQPDECVRCHAPVARAESVTELADAPAHLRGVTCYACHQVAAANAVTHELRLADDGVQLGGIANPVDTGAHASAYSTLLDRDVWRSTDLCGACHEFETTSGAHPHRTYTEWTESLFADTFGRLFLTCSGCHAPGSPGAVATGEVPQRRLHDHSFPGLNVALMDWPERDAQRAAIEADLAAAVSARVCLDAESWQPEVILDNVMGGHMWPSGDAATRHAWVEVVARAGDQVLFESGVAEDDPDAWVLGDRLVDGDGEPVLFTWEAVGVEAELLPPAVTADPADPRYYHAVSRTYPSLPALPDAIDVAVHVRPIGLDIVDELIAGGDLDPAVRARVPVFTLEGTVVRWRGVPGSCEP